MGPIKQTMEMIAEMKPLLLPGEFVFCSTQDDGIKAEAFAVARASFIQDEGGDLYVTVARS